MFPSSSSAASSSAVGNAYFIWKTWLLNKARNPIFSRKQLTVIVLRRTFKASEALV